MTEEYSMYKNINRAKMVKIKGSTMKLFGILVLLIFCSGCFESEVVPFEPEKGADLGDDETTLLPQIQQVYPGTLQTVDIPYTFPTDITPSAAHIILIFSDSIENDGGEMASWLRLEKNDVSVPFSVSPGTSASVFEVIPGSSFTYGAEYSLYIQQAAHKNDDSSKFLNFEPLVLAPATTINPPGATEIEFTFQTATTASVDITPPSLLLTNPLNGEINVDTNLVASGGRILIVFNDNENPMINPLTVDGSSITLTLVGPGTPVAGTVDIDNTDLINFNKYIFTPGALPLNGGATYMLRVSIGNAITDMSGNPLPETAVVFNTL